MKILINFKSNSHEIEISDPSADINHLRQLIFNRTSVPSHAQRLLMIGKTTVRSDTPLDTPLTNYNIKDGDKIAVIGTTTDDLTSIETSNIKLKQRTPLKPGRPYADTRVKHNLSFGSIEVLTHQRYNDQPRAKQLMKELSEDMAITAIMVKNQWSVNRLIEICPKEQPDILGYNMNKGMTIALRLRTDDLSGFRAYNVIRRTLIHELTHMQHSDHDHAFWSLNRQLNLQVETSSSGRRLTAQATASWQTDGSAVSTGIEGGKYRLGGNAPGQNESMRNVLAKAAEFRLTQQEQQEMDKCKNSSST